MTDAREDAVRAATQRWLDATVAADTQALDGMLEPSYTFTHATTSVMDSREEWLEFCARGGGATRAGRSATSRCGCSTARR